MKRGTNFYSLEEEKEIARRYVEDGVSAAELARQYNYSTAKSITDKVKRFYPEYDFKTTRNRKKIYYGLSFELIDNPVKAYFIGLLMTDGYVQSNRNQIGLDLIDEDCIAFISDYFSFEYKKYERPGFEPKYRIVFDGKEYVEQLSRFGIKPKKSLTLEPPVLKDSERKYLPYIVRGIIDGDGSVFESGTSGRLNVSICSGSKFFIEWIKRILEEDFFMEDVGKIKETPKKLYSISFSNRRSIQILYALCYFQPMGMQRKRNKFSLEASETIMEESLKGL
jgi:hypothetical protein